MKSQGFIIVNVLLLGALILFLGGIIFMLYKNSLETYQIIRYESDAKLSVLRKMRELSEVHRNDSDTKDENILSVPTPCDPYEAVKDSLVTLMDQHSIREEGGRYLRYKYPSQCVSNSRYSRYVIWVILDQYKDFFGRIDFLIPKRAIDNDLDDEWLAVTSMDSKIQYALDHEGNIYKKDHNGERKMYLSLSKLNLWIKNSDINVLAMESEGEKLSLLLLFISDNKVDLLRLSIDENFHYTRDDIESFALEKGELVQINDDYFQYLFFSQREVLLENWIVSFSGKYLNVLYENELIWLDLLDDERNRVLISIDQYGRSVIDTLNYGMIQKSGDQNGVKIICSCQNEQKQKIIFNKWGIGCVDNTILNVLFEYI